MTAICDAAGRRFVAALLSAVLLCAAPAASAADDPNYRLGVAAFRAGHYAEALARFEAAEQSGVVDVRLDFNVGSTLFKLGRLDESRIRFERIANNPDWGAFARYNLGLIAERQQRDGDARAHFEAVSRDARGRHVAELARNKLASLASVDAVQPASPSRWRGFLSMAGGWDDNVVLSDDPLILEVSDQEDAFAEIVVSASRRISGTDSQGVRVELSAFGEAYRDLDDFNVATFSPAIAWNGFWEDWSFDTSLGADADFLDSGYYATTTTLRFRASHPIGETLAGRLRVDTSWIGGAADYDYVTGWRERIGAELQSRHTFARLRGGYVLELNARDDFDDNGEFSSYSPTRHSFFVAALREPASWLRIEARVEYRMSDYSDPNRTIDDDGNVIVDERDENRLTFSARSSFVLSPNVDVFVDYAHASNDANLETFEYTQNRVMLGFEALY